LSKRGDGEGSVPLNPKGNEQQETGQLVAGDAMRNSTELPEHAKFEELKLAMGTVRPSTQPAADPWFALRVKPNHEKPVAAALRGKGLQEFLPLLRSRRQWSDRVKIMDMPLFPGYLFCRLNLEDRMPLLSTPGFLYLVGIGRNPEPVDESEILSIRSVLRSGFPVTPWPSLMVGQKVQLKHGPLRGLEGVLTKIANQHRIYVSVTLLKRSISVEVDPQWVQAVGPAPDHLDDSMSAAQSKEFSTQA
jgi:transcription antitermination factor NusG